MLADGRVAYLRCRREAQWRNASRDDAGARFDEDRGFDSRFTRSRVLAKGRG
jgi:hypothetical protein